MGGGVDEGGKRRGMDRGRRRVEGEWMGWKEKEGKGDGERRGGEGGGVERRGEREVERKRDPVDYTSMSSLHKGGGGGGEFAPWFVITRVKIISNGLFLYTSPPPLSPSSCPL